MNIGTYLLACVSACFGKSMPYYDQYNYLYKDYLTYNDVNEGSGSSGVCGISTRLAQDEIFQNKRHYIMTMRHGMISVRRFFALILIICYSKM